MLFSTQKRFDKNEDGKLSHDEWRDWYWVTRGHDVEIEERRDQQLREERFQEWLKEWTEKLCICYDGVIQSADELANRDPEIRALAEKTVAHQMISAIIESGNWEKKLNLGGGEVVSQSYFLPCQQLVKTFLSARDLPCKFEEVADSIQRGTAPFLEDAVLKQWVCGTFWRHLIDALPLYEEYRALPYELYCTLQNLYGALAALQYIMGVKDDEDRAETIEEYFTEFWRKSSEQQRQKALYKQVYYPDLEAARASVREWNLSGAEMAQACEDLLIASFPEYVHRWSLEELMDMDEADLLRETGEEDPALALKMFRVLLDTAQEKLMEPEVAEHLIGYDLLELCQYFKNEQMERQILKELEEDETFARQLFQSACEGATDPLVWDCDKYGLPQLKSKPLALAGEKLQR